MPVAFKEGRGAHLTDLDGNDYVDLVMALGPLLLGHNPQQVIGAAIESYSRGVQFGGQHLGEAELAELVVELVPCADKVVLANTGSEAVQAAVRIARATTGRTRLVKFEGHYHGWIDPLFVNSPGVPPQRPSTEGQVPVVHNVPGQGVDPEVIVCAWNDIQAFDALMAQIGGEVAAVLMEPIPFNFGTFLPASDYLGRVAEVCRENGALLVFDEIVSGFRLGPGGAQQMLGVTPDIATYAKAMAAGFPIAMVAGSEAAMRSAVDGPVIHGGTYNGTPASVAAAVATIGFLADNRDEIYPRLDSMAARLAGGIEERASALGAPIAANQVGSVLQLLWGVEGTPTSFAAASIGKPKLVAELCERLLAHGVHAAPRGILFLSTAHEDSDIDLVLSAFEVALTETLAANSD